MAMQQNADQGETDSSRSVLGRTFKAAKQGAMLDQCVKRMNSTGRGGRMPVEVRAVCS